MYALGRLSHEVHIELRRNRTSSWARQVSGPLHGALAAEMLKAIGQTFLKIQDTWRSFVDERIQVVGFIRLLLFLMPQATNKR